MIASLRGLVALSLIAAALAIVVVLDRGAPAGPIDRRLLPGLEPARVDALELGGGVRLAKDGERWQVVAPVAGPADGAAVADLLGALAAARWERQIDRAPAWTDARTIAIGAGAARTIVHLGPAIAGAQQTWARVDDGPALLVPDWIAGAAARDAAAVRDLHLVRVRPDRITGVELHGRGVDLVIGGAVPIAHLPGGVARVRGDAMDALARTLVALRASSFPADAGASVAGELTVRVLGGTAPDELDARGACPGRPDETRVGGSAGPACVGDGQLDAIVGAARAIADGRAVDPAPLRAAPLVRLELAGAIVLPRGGGFTVRASAAAPAIAADDDAVHAAIDALTAPGTVEPRPAGGASAGGAATIRAAYADGTVDVLDVVETPAGPALHRAGEPFVLRVAPAALAAARATPAALRDRGLIDEEPTALAAIDVVAGARHGRAARGATMTDWSGDVDGAAVLVAAGVIAKLRAARFVAPDAIGAVRLTITATFAAPPVAGAVPAVHVIALGGVRDDGACGARVDGVAVELDGPRCGALAALAPPAR